MRVMRACVAAPQPLAAEAAWEVLKKGGNAVDAAVVAALVQGVVDPQNGGLGGFGTACVHLPASGVTDVLGFYSRVPFGARPDMFASLLGGPEWWGTYPVHGHQNEVGYKSVLIPGAVKGFAELLRRYGTLEWSAALEPAIQLAADGFPIHPDLVSLWSEEPYPNSVTPFYRLIATPAAARIYARPGPRMLNPGDVLVQADMGETMRRLGVHGSEDFYQGEIAQAITRDMASNGGLIGARDLAEYRTVTPSPVAGTYRGYTIVSSPPPDSGITLIQMLQVLEGYRLSEMDPGSAPYLHLLATVMRLCLQERERTLGDPAHTKIDAVQLTSKEHTAELRQEVERALAIPETSMGQRSEHAGRRGYGTSQVSVMDNTGAGISLTHTLGSPSGVVTPGLGFMYNGGMHMLSPIPGRPNSVIPGSFRITAMAPTLLFKDGQLRIVIGGAGAYSLLTAMAQALVNLLDHGMSPLEAVSVPRIYSEGNCVHAEARIPRSVCRDLQRSGWQVVHRLESYGYSSGYVQMIAVDESGRVAAGSDPRKGGMALATSA